MKSFLKNVGRKIKNYFLPESERGKKVTPLFVVIVVVATVAMLISNIVAVKTFPIFNWNIAGYGLTLTCGVVVFPITYVLSDLISEVYGYTWSRRTCWIAFAMNLLMVGIFELSILIPGMDKNVSASFASILGAAPLTFVAGLAAWLVGDLLNDLVFKKMKEKAIEKHKNNGFAFWLRAISSSFVGEIIDSLIFIPILYANLLLSFNVPYPPFYALIAMILCQASIKTAYEICVSPLTYLITKGVKKYEEGFARL